MKPGAPWSVKGIEPEARETAKSEARRAGKTLGEWLNHVILDKGSEDEIVADPIRDPEDWERETGTQLPWTGPIDSLSTRVNDQLAASEAKSAALLGSIESSIGSIAQRLVTLDESNTAGDSEVQARLNYIEEAQKRNLSKDNLLGLESAVGQISVVLQNNADKQDQRIDDTQAAVEALDFRFNETGERVNQALAAVEAAAELYEISDRQSQMLDSLVMDVAAVQAGQREADTRHSEDLASVTNVLSALKEQVQTVEQNLVQSISAPGKEAAEAAATIGAQISANEDRTAAAVTQIEEQISQLASILDRSLDAHNKGVTDLQSAFDSILERVVAIEARDEIALPVSLEEAPAPALQLESVEPVTELEAELESDPQVEASEEEAEPAAETPRPAVLLNPRPAPLPPVTFTTIQPESNKNVSVTLAVRLNPDLVKTRAVEPITNPVKLSSKEIVSQSIEVMTAPEAPVSPEAPVPEITTEDLPVFEMPAKDIIEISAADFEEETSEDASDLQASDETQEHEKLEAAVESEDERALALALEADEPNAVSLEDIFGSEDTVQIADRIASMDSEADKTPETIPDTTPGKPDHDAALREAVSSIPTVRASWAAKSEAAGRAGSIRQVMEDDEDKSSKRSWALAACGMMVGVTTVSAVALWSGETENLVANDERPGLMGQLTAWLIPGDAGTDNAEAVPSITTAQNDPARADLSPAALPASDLVTAANLVADDSAQIKFASFGSGLTAAAQTGDAKAQFALARAYTNGVDVVADRQSAVKWYQSAADQDLAIAQYVLGSLHERGIDVPQNKELAIEWYAAAASGGNRRAMHNLAVAYARGELVGQNLEQAAFWFAQAAQLGLSDAQYNLALLYERGLGVSKDMVAAYKWYTIATYGGDTAASAEADRTAVKLTSSERKIANTLIDAWQPQTMNPVANGLFDISPRAYNNVERRISISKAQTRLETLGYEIVATDGIMDPSTQAAIRAFQTANALDVTGTVTPDLTPALIRASASK